MIIVGIFVFGEQICQVIVVWNLAGHIPCQSVQKTFNFFGMFVIFGDITLKWIVIWLLQVSLPFSELVMAGKMLS